MPQLRADYDNPWQEVLERYFRECLALFLPQAHAEIDWRQAPVFLDKELRQVTPDAELGLRRVASPSTSSGQVWRCWAMSGRTGGQRVSGTSCGVVRSVCASRS